MTGQMTSDAASEKDDLDAALTEAEMAAALDPRIQEVLGKALRAYCSDIVSAPIPDRFMVLLAQLEASERGQS